MKTSRSGERFGRDPVTVGEEPVELSLHQRLAEKPPDWTQGKFASDRVGESAAGSVHALKEMMMFPGCEGAFELSVDKPVRSQFVTCDPATSKGADPDLEDHNRSVAQAVRALEKADAFPGRRESFERSGFEMPVSERFDGCFDEGGAGEGDHGHVVPGYVPDVGIGPSGFRRLQELWTVIAFGSIPRTHIGVGRVLSPARGATRFPLR